jgi:uncharacterized protein YPO0396
MHDLLNGVHGDLLPAALPGFRLHRLEVFNWGTFDSTDGAVHAVPLHGQTTLLLGHNGSGKSTLVDALLTLLVRPGNTRNFNVAAGAGKSERSERSYIRGAYDRRSDEDSRSDVKYLRDGHGLPSVLLACFRNEATGGAFTLAMILYLTADQSVEKLYCFAPDERSIAANCAGLRGREKLAKQMQERGFPKTTKSYNEYFEWIRKATGVQPQAMDMFNQTVAVKDIQRLNDFIRKHMLEAKPWGDKVDELLRHFQDLSDAHRDLLRVRQQSELLQPIEEVGVDYRERLNQLQGVERLLQASDAFFCHKVVDVFGPAREQKRADRSEAAERKDRIVRDLDEERDRCRRLQNDIDQAGGQRLREIPLLIEKHQALANSKRDTSGRFHDALRRASLAQIVTDQASLQDVRAKLPLLASELQQGLTASEEKRRSLIHQHGDCVRQVREEEAELQALSQRRESIPAWLSEIRADLCAELRLKEADLPFTAELIAVKRSEQAWEPSLEMLLRNFALTLLVPDRIYPLVSGYVEGTRLSDAQGRGQRLVYHRIGRVAIRPEGGWHDQSLLHKLDFRPGHQLLPWLKAELQDRFNFRCCDTLEEFQLAAERALTRERHVKHPGGRHEKDDREQFVDPRRYVLGWDNREKRRHLEDGIRRLRQRIEWLDTQITRFDEQQNDLRTRLQATQDALSVPDFAAIDYAADEREIAALRLEKQALEENNEVIRMLKQRLAERDHRVTVLEASREQLVGQMARLDGEIQEAERLIANAEQTLSRLQADERWATSLGQFPNLESYFAGEPLTWENLFDRQTVFSKSRQDECRQLRDQITPLEDQLRKAMSHYLRSYADEKLELVADVKYLGDFLALLARIRAEDLPKHEQRFKERLNEKVGEEIGLLRSAFETERSDIDDRVELLNRSLRQLEYRPGTHMRLQAKPVRDREIAEFRQALYDCGSGAFDGTPEANEQRYVRIEKLIHRLRDEESWRRKVTDVRNWFDFAAVETDDQTGEERSYYEDSSGQSGGEKGKFALTILVAAIAYQYDLQPGPLGQSRFHFVVVDEMLSRIDDRNSKYALDLFAKFNLQLLIVAPLDAKARVTEPYVGSYLHVTKDPATSRSEVFHMTACEFRENMATALANEQIAAPLAAMA